MMVVRITYNSAVKMLADFVSKNCCIPNTIRGFKTITVHCSNMRMRMGMIKKEGA